MPLPEESPVVDFMQPADRPPFSLLVPFLVLALTVVAWIVLWTFPEFTRGMEHLLGASPEPTFSERFAMYWQWVVAGATLWLTITLLLKLPRIRLSATVWAVSLVLLSWASWDEFGIRWLGVIAMLAGILLYRWIWTLASRAA
jgi:hypothetical protein